MKCLVTGGSGFLGSHVADELLKAGHKVIIYDLKKSKWIKKKHKFIKGDILDKKKLSIALKSVDVIYHLAALADLDLSLNNPIKTVNYNILGTVNILDLAKTKKIKRIIFASSIYVNSEQGGFYRVSKKAAEEYVEEYGKRFGINFTILRFGSLYGTRSDKSNGLRKIIESGIDKKSITYYGNLKSVRKYINVIDAAKSCVKILSKKYKNKFLIIHGKKSFAIKTVLKIIQKMFTEKKEIKFNIKKSIGHYINNPYTYKFRKGKSFIIRDQINFENGVSDLFKELAGKIKW